MIDEYSTKQLQDLKNRILTSRADSNVEIHIGGNIHVSVPLPISDKVLDLVVKELSDEISRRISDD